MFVSRRSSWEDATYEFVLISPAVSCMSCSSNWLFVRWEVSGRTAVALWIGASRICSKKHVAFLCNCLLGFFSCKFFRISVVYPYSSTDTITTWKKSCFILTERSDFHLIDYLSIAVHPFAMLMMISLSVDEMFLPRYMNWSTNFRDLSLKGEMIAFWLKHMNSVLSAFTHS